MPGKKVPLPQKVRRSSFGAVVSQALLSGKPLFHTHTQAAVSWCCRLRGAEFPYTCCDDPRCVRLRKPFSNSPIAFLPPCFVCHPGAAVGRIAIKPDEAAWIVDIIASRQLDVKPACGVLTDVQAVDIIAAFAAHFGDPSNPQSEKDKRAHAVLTSAKLQVRVSEQYDIKRQAAELGLATDVSLKVLRKAIKEASVAKAAAHEAVEAAEASIVSAARHTLMVKCDDVLSGLRSLRGAPVLLLSQYQTADRLFGEGLEAFSQISRESGSGSEEARLCLQKGIEMQKELKDVCQYAKGARDWAHRYLDTTLPSLSSAGSPSALLLAATSASPSPTAMSSISRTLRNGQHRVCNRIKGLQTKISEIVAEVDNVSELKDQHRAKKPRKESHGIQTSADTDSERADLDKLIDGQVEALANSYRLRRALSGPPKRSAFLACLYRNDGGAAQQILTPGDEHNNDADLFRLFLAKHQASSAPSKHTLFLAVGPNGSSSSAQSASNG